MTEITGEETAGYPHASDVTNWTPDDRPGEDEIPPAVKIIVGAGWRPDGPLLPLAELVTPAQVTQAAIVLSGHMARGKAAVRDVAADMLSAVVPGIAADVERRVRRECAEEPVADAGNGLLPPLAELVTDEDDEAAWDAFCEANGGRLGVRAVLEVYGQRLLARHGCADQLRRWLDSRPVVVRVDGVDYLSVASVRAFADEETVGPRA